MVFYTIYFIKILIQWITYQLTSELIKHQYEVQKNINIVTLGTSFISLIESFFMRKPSVFYI